MMYLEFTFERGGTLRAKLAPEATRTTQCVRKAAPIKGTVLQARWSGREICVPVQLKEKPPRERQSIRAGIGDVIYFCEWGDSYDQSGFENIGIFYGNEIVREWRGDAPVNVFGQIDPSQWELLKALGERVWRQGGEAITLRITDEPGA